VGTRFVCFSLFDVDFFFRLVDRCVPILFLFLFGSSKDEVHAKCMYSYTAKQVATHAHIKINGMIGVHAKCMYSYTAKQVATHAHIKINGMIGVLQHIRYTKMIFLKYFLFAYSSKFFPSWLLP